MSVSTSTWTRVGRAEDVPMLEGRSVTVDGRRIAIFRLPDGWAATDAACPHKGGPLQDGIVADRCVTCPLHNRRYDFDELVRHDVVERDGALWVRLA
ncbi:MAG TPA: Rieske 2Fe-2S domain-containing protein [Solirubrobacteraceae bacterium]